MDFRRVRRFAGRLGADSLCAGDEPDFDRHPEGGRDPAEHAQRVALVIGVLEPADDRGRGADELRELPLRQARHRPQVVDHPCDPRIRPDLLQGDRCSGRPST